MSCWISGADLSGSIEIQASRTTAYAAPETRPRTSRVTTAASAGWDLKKRILVSLGSEKAASGRSPCRLRSASAAKSLDHGSATTNLLVQRASSIERRVERPQPIAAAHEARLDRRDRCILDLGDLFD